jgi:proteasome alpha subunit
MVASIPDQAALLAHLLVVLADKTLECAVLERQQVGSSKYRALRPAELAQFLPGDFQAVVAR